MNPSTSPSLRLAEMLCGRLCHELSSPLGTLAGVMEMTAEGGATAAEARAVADEASMAVRARLRLLRAAWTSESGPMDATELRALADGLRLSRRVRTELGGLQGHFSAAQSRVLLNMLILGVECLAGNGTMQVAGSGRDGAALRIEGPRAAWPEAFPEWVQNPDTAWRAVDEAGPLQAALTAILGAGMLTLVAEEDRPAMLHLRGE